jgi:hypothetical protein
MDMRPATGAETPKFATSDPAQYDNMSRRDPDTATQLRDLYRSDAIARALFDDAAKRRYVVAKTSVDRIARIVGATRAKAIDLCMLLEEIGVGTYRRAYANHGDKFPPRIYWRYVPRSIGCVAKGEEERLLDIHGEDVAEQGDAIASNSGRQSVPYGFFEYRYPLDEGRIATLWLPIDLTKRDVNRLSNFMTTLAQSEQ